MSVGSDSKFAELTADNIAAVEALYEAYLDDPDGVDPSWKPYFAEMSARENGSAVSRPPGFVPRSIFNATAVVAHGAGLPKGTSEVPLTEPEQVHAGLGGRVASMVSYYRLHGHLFAKIDPLDRGRSDDHPAVPHQFTEQELATTVECGALFEAGRATVAEIVSRLRNTYTRTVGVEYMHIPHAERRRWLQTRMESTENRTHFARARRLALLRKLTHVDALERFLHTKYVGMKRFSIQGGEALLPGLEALIDAAGATGVREIVIGMAHRGRLAVLSSVLNKSAQEIFSEFERNPDPMATLGVGDVKYHMGFSHDHVTRDGHPMHLSLAFNPSHLEAVSPVVLGRTLAKGLRRGTGGSESMALLLHGDAAFAGQGLVAETLQLAQIPGYSTGGAIHIVINNQIGFTTNPSESRSTTYATDVAHMVEIPIFHVNGDDVEALAHVVELAVAYRARFGTDVVIDLVCYRRYGHNEGDEPRFTQPEMYRLIDEQVSVRELYIRRLTEDGVLEKADGEAIVDGFMDEFNGSLEVVRAEPKRAEISQLEGLWAGYCGGEFAVEDTPPPVPVDELRRLGEALAHVPDSVAPHRIISRILRQREEMARGEKAIDWGMGESLAFATLLDAGHPVRISGQDSVRGTFGHRHSSVYDSRNNDRYTPLDHLGDHQGRFEVYNSMLSEAAVLGFDYGFSLDTPDGLVIWEAQFGDFANNAQVIIDQFITSGEAKWRRLSGLVMLLPHGYEGQGPEHSSARLERFLQLCAMDNIIVANLTTPAQCYHALRRQVLGQLRKPLVVMSPKSLLRHKDATSTLEALSEGRFRPVIPEARGAIEPAQVKRVLLCSGKVYYDLRDKAAELGSDDVAIVRVEQLYPLVETELRAAVECYPNRTSLYWVQEEPQNQGAWLYMLPRLIEIFGREIFPEFAGRMASASPATGSPESHAIEQQLFLEAAFANV